MDEKAPLDDLSPLLGNELDLGKLREKYADLPAPSARLDEARACKDRGGMRFVAKDFEGACDCYKEAVEAIANEWDFTAMEVAEAKKLRVVCHSNAAQCHLKMKRYFEARCACDAALEIDDEHAKTLYRRGMANANLAAFDSARRDLRRALALDPDNKFVKKELKRLETRVASHKKKERRVFERAFQKMDGVFSENREEEEDFERPGAGTFARCVGWIGKTAEALLGQSWPWLGTAMPLTVVMGRFMIGGDAGSDYPVLAFFGSGIAARAVCSCMLLLSGVLQLRWAQRKRHWLPDWFGGDDVRNWAEWASGSLSCLLAWSMGLSRSDRELSFVARVAMAFVLLASSSAALGERGGERKLRKAAKASSVLLLLLLLGQHT